MCLRVGDGVPPRRDDVPSEPYERTDLSFMGDQTNRFGAPVPAPGVCILGFSFPRHATLVREAQTTISE